MYSALTHVAIIIFIASVRCFSQTFLFIAASQKSIERIQVIVSSSSSLLFNRKLLRKKKNKTRSMFIPKEAHAYGFIYLLIYLFPNFQLSN